MVRKILIDDPEFVFPPSLQQVTLYRSMQGTSELHSLIAKHKMKIFYIITFATFAWQFLPEFVFPMLAVLAPLCWFAPNNHKVNFLGSGKGGIGLLNFTLDWSNITSTVITYPYSVQIVIFVGFVITTWILIPIAYFGNIWGSPTYNIMSQGLFTKNGSSYPFESLLYTDASGTQQVNETAYNEVGLSYAGAQYTWSIFMWYASYMSSYIWAALFLAPKIKNLWKNRKNLGQYRTDRLRLIGHYLHIPPRDVIGIQIAANIVAGPINYGVMKGVLTAKYKYLTGELTDPSGQWTAQDFQSYNTAGVLYALVGPKRLFASSYFAPVLYGFLVGFVAPVTIWLLHKKFPKARFDLWNTTIFFASMATFRGNLSTGPFTSIIVGTVFNYYLYRYRHNWWNKWAYISGAALDTGYNLNLLFTFLFLGTTGAVMANWWGNDARNSERCFALKS
ncbi:hypothetical protein SLS53_004928 [Cytospora paraplurivora]|uniref:Uncharacterized protein n=1 Tax=Cytospora paraplurivora TaxID=2898453 RepID=A0AAN9YGY3_9PEZI